MASEQDDALRETLRLIGELGEALVTQVRRLQRLAEGEEAAAPAGLADTIAEDAERVKQRCDELRRQLGRPRVTEVVDPEPAGAGDPTAGREAPPAIGDAVHTLAIEMRMEGRTREEVEQYLARSFGRDDAARIADEVFRPG